MVRELIGAEYFIEVLVNTPLEAMNNPTLREFTRRRAAGICQT